MEATELTSQNMEVISYEDAKNLLWLAADRMVRNMPLSGMARILEVVNEVVEDEVRCCEFNIEHAIALSQMIEKSQEAIKIARG